MRIRSVLKVCHYKCIKIGNDLKYQMFVCMSDDDAVLQAATREARDATATHHDALATAPPPRQAGRIPRQHHPRQRQS